jgi:hypothetical protein
MKRRTLLHTAAAAALLPLTASAQDRKPIERVVARVGNNHGHVFVVTPDEVRAGVEKTYDLTGAAGHPHSVTVTAEQFKRIGAGEVVRFPSTRDGHLHRLLVRVAPAVDPPDAANVCAVTIGGKDEHELIVTAADVAAGVDKTFDIQGISPHGHALKLTAADFEKMKRGGQAQVNSGTATPGEDHYHLVYVRYPGK